jgi:hypothetical protein
MAEPKQFITIYALKPSRRVLERTFYIPDPLLQTFPALLAYPCSKYALDCSAAA